MRQIAAAIDDALDADSIGDHAEEDNIMAHDSKPGCFADLGAQLVKIRLFADFQDGMPNLPDQPNCPLRTILSDEIGDAFEVGLDKAGEL